VIAPRARLSVDKGERGRVRAHHGERRDEALRIAVEREQL
jgi:hypothetical protein